MNLRPFRVLTIDGGGVRGLYTATLLQKLARWFETRRSCGTLDIGKGFDLIAGTSTGGILACGLAAGVELGSIVELYRAEGPKLFSDPVPSGFNLLGWIWRHLHRPGNPSEPLRDALRAIFGSETLAELWDRRGIALCIPSVDARSNLPRVFKTPHVPSQRRDDRWPLQSVCLATSAAPIVLPLAECSDPDNASDRHVFADGGLWANDPVLVGLVEALKLAAPNQPVHILSIGTCSPPQGRVVEEVGWGLARWRFGLTALEMALEAQSAGAQHMAQFLANSVTRPCVVTRMPEASVSPDQRDAIGLDRASERSLRVLADLAEQAANVAMSEINRPTERGKQIAAFFEELPIAKRVGE